MSESAPLRRWLLALLALALAGTGVELLLLEHTESAWQLVPLALIGIGLVTTGGCALRATPATVYAQRAVMVLCAASGLVGIQRHYAGNAEFELEMYPSLTGLDLVREAAQGATPLLAPGTMLYLGLLGVALTMRHPALAARAKGARP